MILCIDHSSKSIHLLKFLEQPCILYYRRMNYSDAIKYLKEHNIKKDDGTYYEFGEVRLMLATSKLFDKQWFNRPFCSPNVSLVAC